MPALALTTTTTAEVKLKPHLKRKLITEIKTIKELRVQAEAIDAAIRKHVGSVQGVLEESGEEKINIEGIGKATMVFGAQSKLDKKLYVLNGGNLADLDAATVTTPKKPYCKITLAGERQHDEDS